MDGPDAEAYANRVLTQHGRSVCERVVVGFARRFWRELRSSKSLLLPRIVATIRTCLSRFSRSVIFEWTSLMLLQLTIYPLRYLLVTYTG